MLRTVMVGSCLVLVTAGGCERIREETENDRITKAVIGSWVLDDISARSDDAGEEILASLVFALLEPEVELTLSDDGTFYRRQGVGAFANVETGEWSVRAGLVQTGKDSWANVSHVRIGDERYRYQGGRLIQVDGGIRTVLKRK